uniref:LLGL domain-containing protein n=1 Tax=Panagrellus redivivus TaxID=6233 RepID=A0A7E4UZA7_PANRE
MWRFFRQHFGGHHANRPANDSARLTDQQRLSDAADYVQFEKLSNHGFPSNPACFAVDTKNKRIAIGTEEGRVQIYGDRNTGWSITFTGRPKAQILNAITDTGQFLLVAAHNDVQQIYKITINGETLAHQRYPLPIFMKRICSTVVLPATENKKQQWLVGTASGNIYSFNIETLDCSDFLVFDDLVPQSANIDSDKREFRSLAVEGDHIIAVIGKHHYVVANWKTLERVRFGTSDIEITGANVCNDEVIIGTIEGDLSIGKLFDNLMQSISFYEEKESKNQPNVNATLSRDGSITFINGLPADEFGDRCTVTYKSPTRHEVFDFDSPVIEYFQWFEEQVLFILCKQELCVIDLTGPKSKPFDLPYLYPVHSVPVTCSQVVSDIPPDTYNRIVEAGVKTKAALDVVSKRPWIFDSPDSTQSTSSGSATILMTGHENGDVIFWNVDRYSMRPLTILQTAKEFECYQDQIAIQKEREAERDPSEPPFVRCGLFENLSDDPRFSVQKALFDPASGYLSVGGRAGQVLLFELFDTEYLAPPPSVCEINMIEAVQNEPRVNSGLKPEVALLGRTKPIKYSAGFRPAFEVYMQLKPPVPVQTMAINAALFHIAIGIEYGYVVADFKNKQNMCKNSLLPADDIVKMVANDGHLSRFKSVKKSIRKSFRRKRGPEQDRSFSNMGDTTSNIIEDLRPMEREIVAKPRSTSFNASKGDVPPSSVRMLRYVKAPIGDDRVQDLLIVGTSGATLFIHSVEADFLAKRYNKIRDISLKHDSPVLHVEITQGCLILFSEEQIRTFHVPSLRNAKYKFKLTALEGSRIQKAQLVELQSVTDPSKKEEFIATLTQRGEIFLFYPSNLKKLTKVQYTLPADGSGIASATLAKDGTLFYLNAGGSEFRKCSIAATTGLATGAQQI